MVSMLLANVLEVMVLLGILRSLNTLCSVLAKWKGLIRSFTFGLRWVWLKVWLVLA